jgi:hypothetical protein
MIESANLPTPIFNTPEGKAIYNRWRAFSFVSVDKEDENFTIFRRFYDWSIANGFVIGARLIRIDVEKPWSSHNCEWRLPKVKDTLDHGELEAAYDWNRVVNVFRRYYGMEPFPERGVNNGS